jgi:hypothetical protein
LTKTAAPFRHGVQLTRTSPLRGISAIGTLTLAGFILLYSTLSPASSYNSYSTYLYSPPSPEQPIYEHGHWKSGGAAKYWANVATNSGKAFVYANGMTAPYADGTAVLTGTWGSTQALQGTVYTTTGVPKAGSPCYPEVELRLHTTINSTYDTITGYEVFFSVGKTSASYMGIARWNGSRGSFNYLVMKYGSNYGVVNGSTVSATISSTGVIKAYINGVLVASATSTTFPTGAPGMGFNFGNTSPCNSTSVTTTYGFKYFSANAN